jgi:hypothetical protein
MHEHEFMNACLWKCDSENVLLLLLLLVLLLLCCHSPIRASNGNNGNATQAS